MSFLAWLAANAAFVFIVSRIDTDKVSDPIGTSWLIIAGWILMNLAIGAFILL